MFLYSFEIDFIGSVRSKLILDDLTALFSMHSCDFLGDVSWAAGSHLNAKCALQKRTHTQKHTHLIKYLHWHTI